jgi:hypothetical protein
MHSRHSRHSRIAGTAGIASIAGIDRIAGITGIEGIASIAGIASIGGIGGTEEFLRITCPTRSHICKFLRKSYRADGVERPFLRRSTSLRITLPTSRRASNASSSSGPRVGWSVVQVLNRVRAMLQHHPAKRVVWLVCSKVQSLSRLLHAWTGP